VPLLVHDVSRMAHVARVDLQCPAWLEKSTGSGELADSEGKKWERVWCCYK